MSKQGISISYVGADNSFISNIQPYTAGIEFISTLIPKSFRTSNIIIGNPAAGKQLYTPSGPDMSENVESLDPEGNLVTETLQSYVGFTTTDIQTPTGSQYVTESSQGINRLNYKFNRTLNLSIINSLKELAPRAIKTALKAPKTLVIAPAVLLWNTAFDLDVGSNFTLAPSEAYIISKDAIQCAKIQFAVYGTGGDPALPPVVKIIIQKAPTGSTTFTDIPNSVFIQTLEYTDPNSHFQICGSTMVDLGEDERIQITAQVSSGSAIVDNAPEGSTFISISN